MEYRILPLKDSRALRRAFLRKFSAYDPSHCCALNGTYREKLSESVKPRNILSNKTALALISNFPEVFVTWDSAVNIKERNLRKVPLVSLSGKNLADAIRCDYRRPHSEHNSLPDEIFVFDRALTFYIAFTAEYIQGIGNTCLTSLNVIRDNGMPSVLSELYSLSHQAL